MQVDVQLLKIYFTWAASNALITNRCSAMKKVGFLLVIPYSVTNYITVYSALRNFEDMRKELGQQMFALILTKCFGSNALELALSRDHYVRSLLGMQIIKE